MWSWKECILLKRDQSNFSRKYQHWQWQNDVATIKYRLLRDTHSQLLILNFYGLHNFYLCLYVLNPTPRNHVFSLNLSKNFMVIVVLLLFLYSNQFNPSSSLRFSSLYFSEFRQFLSCFLKKFYFFKVVNHL